VTAAISGFSIDDMIDTTNVDAASFNAPAGVLSLSDHNVHVASLHLVGSFAGDVFGAAADGSRRGHHTAARLVAQTR
jgi:hypothetical protein